jgi:hypothetical protein
MAKRISIRGGATALPEESVAHLSVSLIKESGVENLTTDFIVSENNPQNLSVNVSSGRAFFVKSGMVYHGYSTETVNLSITANSSGNDRIDAVVLYVDLMTSPNSDASNILKYQVVQGTPASSPVAPTDNEIQTAIGAGNPFIRLANVYVANNDTTITNDNITDKRTKSYIKTMGMKEVEVLKSAFGGNYNKIYEANVSGSVNLDCDTCSVFILTLSGNTTINFTNFKKGQTVHLIITNASSYTITWGSMIKWSDDTTPGIYGNYNGLVFFAISNSVLIGNLSFSGVSI